MSIWIILGLIVAGYAAYVVIMGYIVPLPRFKSMFEDKGIGVWILGRTALIPRERLGLLLGISYIPMFVALRLFEILKGRSKWIKARWSAKSFEHALARADVAAVKTKEKLVARYAEIFGFGPGSVVSSHEVAVQRWWVQGEFNRARAAMEDAFREQERIRHADLDQKLSTREIDEVVGRAKGRYLEMKGLIELFPLPGGDSPSPVPSVAVRQTA